ncbi:MAG: hypothetical protein WBB59_08740 [Candidatus Microthrix parvicella]
MVCLSCGPPAIAPGIAWTLAVLALLGAGAGYLGFTTGLGFAGGVSLIQVGVLVTA